MGDQYFFVIISSSFIVLSKIANMWNELINLENEINKLKEINDNIKKNNDFLQLVIQDVININKPNTYKWNNLFSKTVRQIYTEQGKLEPLTNLELYKKQKKWKDGLIEIDKINNYVMSRFLNNLWTVNNFRDYNKELLNFEIEMFFSKLRFLYSDYIINSIYFERNNANFFRGEAFEYSNNLSSYFEKHTLPKSFEKEYRNFYKINNKNPNDYIKPFAI